MLTRRINEFLNYPVMHLDKVYHTEGKSHITREELVTRFSDFADIHDNWIMDGNYISTLDIRVKMADTIILMNIPSDICLANASKRFEESLNHGIIRSDMAEGFDETITEDFRNFIINFEKETLPRIKEILESHADKNVIMINSYSELDKLVERLF